MRDLFPNEQVYTVKVQGADTENVLRVEKPGDRTSAITSGPKYEVGGAAKQGAYGQTQEELDAKASSQYGIYGGSAKSVK